MRHHDGYALLQGETGAISNAEAGRGSSEQRGFLVPASNDDYTLAVLRAVRAAAGFSANPHCWITF